MANKEINMTSGAIAPNLFRMAAPLMASSVLQLLFNAVDVIVVGNFASENSLAAVGSTAPLINLLVNFFLGLSIGSNALVSFYLGAKDDENVSKTVHSSILMSLVGGAILTIIGVFYARDLLVMMQSPEETLALATLYLQIYFGGSIAMLIFNFGSSILRAKGDTKRPLYYLAFAGIVNVLLNLVLTLVFDLDVAGVAVATVVAQCISAWLVMRCLANETDAFHFELAKLRFDRKIVGRILHIGVPAGFQGIVFSLSNTIIQAAINTFGPIAMAGSAAAASIEGFVWISMNAFSHCALTFVSQNIGAKKYERINRITLIACLFAAGTGALLGNLAYLFGTPLLKIYDARPEVVASGLRRMFMICCFYWTCGLMDCIVGAIRGMGGAMTPTTVSLLGACGLRILWIFTIFQEPKFHTESTLFFSYPLSWVVTFAAHCVCYYIIRRRYPKGSAPKKSLRTSFIRRLAAKRAS